jgi:hypothetical protein
MKFARIISLVVLLILPVLLDVTLASIQLAKSNDTFAQSLETSLQNSTPSLSCGDYSLGSSGLRSYTFLAKVVESAHSCFQIFGYFNSEIGIQIAQTGLVNYLSQQKNLPVANKKRYLYFCQFLI